MTAWWMSLWAAPAALGFALFFNVRRRTLLPIAVLAVLAHLLRAWLLSLGWDLVSASFAAAFLTGAAAYVMGPLTGEASPVYAFAPVIPLVPGSLMFDGLQELAEVTRASSSQDLTGFSVAGQQLVTAGGVVLALAFGATAPGLLRPKARQAH
jgi:uncharacterized membrane protein YjjB (DUF3815 family)